MAVKVKTQKTITESVTARRPRVLVVGGEAKNFKGAAFGERFDTQVHLKTDGNSLSGVKGKFDVVVGLPWITPTLSRNAKIWAKNNGIVFIESPKVGQIEYWLAQKFKWADAYFKELDRKPKVVVTEESIASSLLPAPASAPSDPPTAMLWDEDQLWSAYGEPFVRNLKGLDGETCDRKTFIDLMQDETGLRGEPVEILISLLRRQGVIAEDEGVVSIGKVAPLDIEKRKKFIERNSIKKPFNNGGGSIRDEVREALADEEEDTSEAKPVNNVADLVAHFKMLKPDTVYYKLQQLFDDLTRTGLLRNGKQYSLGAFRLFLARVEDAGEVWREKTGIGVSFRVRIKGINAAPKPEVAPQIPTQAVDAQELIRIKPIAQVPTTVPTPPTVLTSKPFAALLPDPSPAAVPAAPELPFPAPAEEKDISKQGVLYDMLLKNYPNGRMPELGGLVAAVKAFRGLFYETAWDTAAAKGILLRLRLPVTEPNQRRTAGRRLDFTDDEWSYFALEYLRDQTLFALLPLIDNTNRVWRICTGCDKHFHFNIPLICYDCREDNRRLVVDAKGGNQ
jgi:hypothetical protein